MQKSATQDNQRTSMGINWFGKLDKYQMIFTKSAEEQEVLMKEHNNKVLRIDREIAKITGTNRETICVFRSIIELYNYCEYLRIRDGENSSKEGKRKEISKTLRKEEKNLPSSGIAVLLEQECGQQDYGTTELQTKLNSKAEKIENVRTSTKPQPKTEEVTKEKKKAEQEMEHKSCKEEAGLIEKEETARNSTGISKDRMQFVKKAVDNADEEMTEIFTIWDIPAEVSTPRVKRCLYYFGRTNVLQWKLQGKNKALVFSISFWNEHRRQVLSQAWAVHFEEGKTCRITPGSFAKEILEKRAAHKAVVKNIPKTAVETLLLRQLKVVKAKAVYISFNTNRNQRGTASIYFETDKDRLEALDKQIFYYNTKLEWARTENGKRMEHVEKENSKSRYFQNRIREPKDENSREGEEAYARNIRIASRRNSCSIKTWTDHRTLHTMGSDRSKTGTKNMSVHSKKWNPKHEEVSGSTNEEIEENLEIKLMLNQILNRLNKIESRYHAPDKGEEAPQRS